MQRLVYGADVDVMPMLMLIALYSSRGKRVTHARGKAEKCNAASSGNTSGEPDDFKCVERCTALARGCRLLSFMLLA